MDLCQHARLVLLVLGITLGTIQQIVARGQQVSCNRSQYLHEKLNKCCSRCPPGHYVKEECNLTKETSCLPCESGTFASNWNFANICRTCYPCGVALVEKTPCNATHATDCACPDGYSCSQYDGLNKDCEICTLDQDLLLTQSSPTESPPSDVRTMWIWIIGGVIFFTLAAIVLILCIKPPLLKRFGRMIKNKKCSESYPQAEMTVEVVADPLLDNGPIKKPLQESVKLNYPIQESSTTEIGESTLIPKRME